MSIQRSSGGNTAYPQVSVPIPRPVINGIDECAVTMLVNDLPSSTVWSKWELGHGWRIISSTIQRYDYLSMPQSHLIPHRKIGPEVNLINTVQIKPWKMDNFTCPKWIKILRIWNFGVTFPHQDALSAKMKSIWHISCAWRKYRRLVQYLVLDKIG